MTSIKGVNRYLNVGVDYGWIKNYLENPDFEPGNRKTDTMFSFLNDAEMVKKRKMTRFGELIKNMNINSEITWALMLCNLAYSAPFRWYIENIPLYKDYNSDNLLIDMNEATQKARGEFWNSFKVILDSNEYLQRIGFGTPDITSKTNKNAEVKKTLNSITRASWREPDPRVILYSLYKFAEKCGTYQFRLSTLMDDTIERDGISPTRIFGLDRDTMISLLNGLTVNYIEFIDASFTLGLETITLRSEKTPDDVLALF